MSLLCRIWGHKIHPEAAYYYSVWSCERCGDVFEDECGAREWLRIRVALICDWLDTQWLSLRLWWRCTECGRRFGRHDDRFDHLPF